jgi:hypothetical protein
LILVYFSKKLNHETMKRKLLLTITLILGVSAMQTRAQLVVGDTAPDWTFTDINGVSQNLYSYLDAGKTVVIDISAIWCPPCWQYHSEGILEDFYDIYGPEGTNVAMVFMIEGDGGTNTDCLYGQTGCNSTTQGDWVTNTPYPICDPIESDANSFLGDYSLEFYPTIYLVCPDKKIRLASAFDFDTGTGQYLFSVEELEAAMNENCSTSSIRESEIDKYLSVYPNPSSGNVNIKTNSDNKEIVKLKIINELGEIIFDNINLSSKEVNFNLTDQPNGIYLIEVTTGNGTISKKITLEK